MPSTRKQKAMEKRSRQSDMMSDMENLDVMLGSYSRNEIGSQNNGNVEDTDQRSSERQTNCRRLPPVTVQESLLPQKDRKLRPKLYQYIRGKH